MPTLSASWGRDKRKIPTSRIQSSLLKESLSERAIETVLTKENGSCSQKCSQFLAKNPLLPAPPSSRFLTKYLQINPGGTWQKLEEKVIISVRLRMGYPKVFLQVIYLFLIETHSDRNWEMQKYLLCRVGEICHFFVVEISALWKHANEFRKGRNWLDVGHATQWT